MCKLCKTKPVYEFTNQTKLCASCFIRYFQKKFFYTIRKFGMINVDADSIYYEKGNDFRSVVLKDVLGFFQEKTGVDLHSLKARDIDISSEADFVKLLRYENSYRSNKSSTENCGRAQFEVIAERQRGNLKIAIPTTIDLTSHEIVKTLIKKDSKKMKKLLPVYKNEIKPLYLFLDEEVLLYAQLRKLKFVKKKEVRDKISDFIDGVEKKHPEVKRAIVNGYLKLYNKKV